MPNNIVQAKPDRGHVLRALGELLSAHPEVEMPSIDSGWDGGIGAIRFQLTSDGEETAANAAVIISAFPGTFRKDADDSYMEMWGEFEGVPVKIAMMRADVCVARQVGTETVMQKDPEALKAVPEVAVEVPKYEWDCKPILAAAS